jgi:hypothetical protein
MYHPREFVNAIGQLPEDRMHPGRGEPQILHEYPSLLTGIIRFRRSRKLL